MRCDFDVPLVKQPTANSNITNINDSPEYIIADDNRIRRSLPTIQHLLNKGANVVLCSHLGQANGTGYQEEYSLAPVAARLSQLLNRSVALVPDCISLSVERAVEEMQQEITLQQIGHFNSNSAAAAASAANTPSGGIVLLENMGFYAEEEQNDPEFSRLLAFNADVFVNDAFSTAHLSHASTEGVAQHVKAAVAGFLLQKELDYLQGAVQHPQRPFAAIVGGSKVSSKISVIEAMLSKVDKLVLGGGMVFTFLKARGLSVGTSLVEDNQLELARKLEKIAADKGVKLYLASDVVVADRFASDAATRVVDVGAIPDGWMGLDIGPKSIAELQQGLADCKTIIWNGPMGVFEFEAFANGTNAVATTLAELTTKGCVTIIGGGDSVAAVEKAGLADNMSHISTGGDSMLALIEDRELPGVAALNEA